MMTSRVAKKTSTALYSRLIMGATIASTTLALLTACGGDSDSPSGSYGYNDTRLAGSYGGMTLMNGYDVVSEVEVKPNGDFLGVAFNTLEDYQPSSVYTIIKGNVNGAKLYEFDLINSSINRYYASGEKGRNYNSITFDFSDVPRQLRRPSSLRVDRLQATSSLYLNSLVGFYETSTLDVFNRLQSSLSISNTANSSQLKMSYVGDDGCLLNGTIIKQSYQTSMADVNGKFTGSTCSYNGQQFEGLITYDNSTQSIVMYGATDSNTNGMVVVYVPDYSKRALFIDNVNDFTQNV